MTRPKCGRCWRTAAPNSDYCPTCGPIAERTTQADQQAEKERVRAARLKPCWLCRREVEGVARIALGPTGTRDRPEFCYVCNECVEAVASFARDAATEGRSPVEHSKLLDHLARPYVLDKFKRDARRRSVVADDPGDDDSEIPF